MLQIFLVRPGATDFDDQGRIKGTLDIPLSKAGTQQVAETRADLCELHLDAIYTAPCQSALQTAGALAEDREVKVKTVDKLVNLDHGLWHGKLIEELRNQQPKVYKQWQERPETVCPPQGESFQAARDRVRSALVKILRKHSHGLIAIVAPEPVASMLRSLLASDEIGDLWKAERDTGHWERIDVGPEQVLCK